MSRPHSSPQEEGFHDAQLLSAFKEAVSGKTERLEFMLCRAAGWPGGKLNLKLAAAFGAQIAETKADPLPLLRRFADDDAATNTPRVFLPVCAVYGWVAMLRAERETDAAWTAVCELGADGRNPIRLSVIEALSALIKAQASTDALVTRALEWLDLDDREWRFGVAAMVLDLLGDDGLSALARDQEQLRNYLSRVISEIGDAPRAAERSETRRRALTSLPRALATAAVRMQADAAETWLVPECERASHPRVREALSDAIVMMRKRALKTLADTLTRTLEASATPLRDPTRLRKGTARGKGSRRIR